MAKKLVIRMTLEDDENWRDCVSVQRVWTPSELNHLRAGAKEYVAADAWDMYCQLQEAEKVRSHG